MESSIEKIFKELRAVSTGPVISKEEYAQAAKEINAKMEKFDIEWKAYMAQSIESARHAYITF